MTTSITGPGFAGLLLLITVLVVYALITGRTRRRNFTLVTRDESPGEYWLSIGLQAVVFVGVVYLWSTRGFAW